MNKNRRRHPNPRRKLDHDPDAYGEGRDARCERRGLSTNPYPRGTTKHREWSRGWRK